MKHFGDITKLSGYDLPIVDIITGESPQEPKTGHWNLEIEDWNKWTCSECSFCERTDIHVSLGYNYCPNCGAKMVETQESEEKNVFNT